MSDIDRRITVINMDRRLSSWEILTASAFICRHGSNPTELLDMLGLTNDLQKVRNCRRLAKSSTPPRM